MSRIVLTVLCLAGLIGFSTPSRAGIGTDLFTRGDANEDGMVNIGDAVFILSALFGLGPQPNCPDAADTNDDGLNNVADGVFLLSFLFVAGSPQPPEPFVAPGVDPTVDGMQCGVFCVDPTEFEDLFTSVFPFMTCVPPAAFSEAGFDVDYCVQTTSPSCAGLAGCEAVVELNSFSYDVDLLEGNATLTVTIDPIGLTYDSFLFSGSCDGSLTTDVDIAVFLSGVEVAPGVTEVTDVTLDLAIVNTAIDLSACGAIGFLASFFIDTVISGLGDEFETLAQDQIAPLLIGTPLCTGTP